MAQLALLRHKLTHRLAIFLAGAAFTVNACSPVPAINRLLVPDENFDVISGIPYGADARHSLDVYVPRETPEATSAEPKKVVVYFYGGSWQRGRRDYYRFIGEALSSRGYITVIPDYRLYPDVRFPAFVEDGANVVQWVRESIAAYGGNPDALFLMGHSAGAHIAALLASDDQYLAGAGVPRYAVRGMIGLAGPYSLDPSRYRSTRRIFAGSASLPTQPIVHVDGAEPAMLLLHGQEDRIVDPAHSRAMVERVRASGGMGELVEYPGIGHVGIISAIATPFREPGGPLDTISDFITSH
jgi:acetyl esterase/lipase